MAGLGYLTEIALECGCELYFKKAHIPQKGDSLYCPTHGTFKTVIEAPPQFHTKCRNCAFGRTHGASRTNAFKQASEHVQKRVTHLVIVYDGQRKVGEIRGHVPDPIPGLIAEDIPPF